MWWQKRKHIAKPSCFFFSRKEETVVAKAHLQEYPNFFIPTTCSFAIPKRVLEGKKKAYLQEFLIIHS